ncbi:CoA transferase [bacterium]|nr:MAG: CoA transferase [bacterium]
MSGTQNAGAWEPLAGIRILDFSVLLPGPFATLALADLGADVIKVEAPAGDEGRTITGLHFASVNRNKRSIALDLKDAASRPVVARLAAWADVAIETFRPGVAQRLGIDAGMLRSYNERLIYCSLSGYGQNGPQAQTPGHDLNYLAAAGTLALASHWGDERPRRAGVPVADLAGGTYAAIAILSALYERERTGRGRQLDLSLFEAALSFTATRRGLGLDAPTRLHLYPTNDLFETADGRYIVLGLVEDRFWANFMRALGDEASALRDARFASEALRREHGDVLEPILRATLRAHAAEEWLARFSRHDVPAQLVVTPREASRGPQMRARELVVERDGETHLPFPVIADGTHRPALRSTAPSLNQHADDILRELGMEARA